jgi:hypothetical protein
LKNKNIAGQIIRQYLTRSLVWKSIRKVAGSRYEVVFTTDYWLPFTGY